MQEHLEDNGIRTIESIFSKSSSKKKNIDRNLTITDSLILDYMIDNINDENLIKILNKDKDIKLLILEDYYLNFYKNDNILDRSDISFLCEKLKNITPTSLKKREKISTLDFSYKVDSNLVAIAYLKFINNELLKSLIKTASDKNDLKALLFLDTICSCIKRDDIINDNKLNLEQKAIMFAKEYYKQEKIKEIDSDYKNLKDNGNILERLFNDKEINTEQIQALIYIDTDRIKYQQKYLLFNEKNPELRDVNKKVIELLNELEKRIKEKKGNAYSILEEKLALFHDIHNSSTSYKDIGKLRKTLTGINFLNACYNLLGSSDRVTEIANFIENINTKIKYYEKIETVENKLKLFSDKCRDYKPIIDDTFSSDLNYSSVNSIKNIISETKAYLNICLGYLGDREIKHEDGLEQKIENQKHIFFVLINTIKKNMENKTVTIGNSVNNVNLRRYKAGKKELEILMKENNKYREQIDVNGHYKK